MNSETQDVLLHQQPDWLLQNLIGVVNRNKVSYDITIHIKGTILTGTVVGGAEYFEELGKKFAEGLKASAEIAGIEYDPEGDGSEMFKDVIEELYPSSGERSQDSQENESSEPTSPTFIHLKSVRVLMPTDTPFMGQSTYWRFRLSEIDGWVLGRGERTY